MSGTCKPGHGCGAGPLIGCAKGPGCAPGRGIDQTGDLLENCNAVLCEALLYQAGHPEDTGQGAPDRAAQPIATGASARQAAPAPHITPATTSGTAISRSPCNLLDLGRPMHLALY